MKIEIEDGDELEPLLVLVPETPGEEALLRRLAVQADKRDVVWEDGKAIGSLELGLMTWDWMKEDDEEDEEDEEEGGDG